MNWKSQTNKILFFFLMLVFVISCTEPIPRKPVSRHTESVMSKSVEFNRKVNAVEVAAIKFYIAQDSLKTYQVSPNGFWYTYLTKVNELTEVPKIGQEVSYEYEIYGLDNQAVYTKDEIGIQKYIIDKEDIASGLQDGLKLMKEGEELKLLLPSYKAFGIAGDKSKIRNNQPLIYKVKLIEINK